MTADRGVVPDPPRAPDDIDVMDTGSQPFLTRAARRAAREEHGSDVELPPIAHVPRYLALVATLVAATLVGVSGAAGEELLAFALLLGSAVIAWGWPRAAGLPSPRGSGLVMFVTGVALIGADIAAEQEPYLRWAPAALAFGVVLMFLHQLMRKDGRPRLVESVMGTGLGLTVLASGIAYLPLVHVANGPQIIACAMAAVAAGTLADLLVGHGLVRPWLLPLAMVLGGFASVVLSLVLHAPDLPPAALIGVCAAALSHVVRRLVSPVAGSYSGQGQIATGLASVSMVGALLWAINDLIIR